MAKITDPDLLNQGTEIVIDTSARTIELSIAGNLSTDGVSIQAIYSFLKEEWKSDASLIKFPFPMIAITPEQFEFIDSWSPSNSATIELLRDGGFAIKNSDGSSAEEYAGIITLGTIGATHQVYYQQEDGGSSTNVVLTGAVNQCVKTFGDGSGFGVDNSVAIDYRSFFKLFVREYQFSYAQSEQSDIGVTQFTYQAYRFPLANSDDLKITHDDLEVSSNAPYTDMTITYLDGEGFTLWADATVYAPNSVVQDGNGRWFITTTGGTSSGLDVGDDVGVSWTPFAGERLIGSTYYPFTKVIDGSSALAEEIYEFVQYSLRQNTDIDAGAGTEIGVSADALLKFVGDTLVSETGVFVDQFNATDTNRLEFFDATSQSRTFPFVSAGIISFNQNLIDDSGAIYRMFFSDANGNNFGDTDAIIVQDNDDLDIAGDVPGSGSVSFSFDYDGNSQGGRTPQTDANVTVVAIGLDKAQYVKATSIISRSIANSISLVAALERNYI